MPWRNIVWGQQQVRFWLEWDRGTMNVRDLAIKFTSYAQYIASREWVREDSMLPVLLCVVPEIGQERRMQRVAQARLHISCRIDGVDDHRGALERARATGAYLVAEQSSSTVRRFAQTTLLRCDSWQKRQVRR